MRLILKRLFNVITVLSIALGLSLIIGIDHVDGKLVGVFLAGGGLIFVGIANYIFFGELVIWHKDRSDA